MRPTFDERDAAILAERSAELLKNPINVGDFITFADGVTRRVSYVWVFEEGKPESIQTSDDGGGFYLGDGYVSFSGSLYRSVPFESLTDTGDLHDGRVWFFHHGYAGAHCGVEGMAKFRVWRCSEGAPS